MQLTRSNADPETLQYLIDALSLIGYWPDEKYPPPGNRVALLSVLHRYAPRLTDRQLLAIQWIVMTFICDQDPLPATHTPCDECNAPCRACNETP